MGATGLIGNTGATGSTGGTGFTGTTGGTGVLLILLLTVLRPCQSQSSYPVAWMKIFQEESQMQNHVVQLDLQESRLACSHPSFSCLLLCDVHEN